MEKPASQNSKPASQQPASDLLAAMYFHAPMLVVVMDADGVVLHCNAATSRVTGFSEAELVGKNFWSLLFPGRLFAQVPRFISAIHPGQILGNDASLMMRTREGKDCVVAWRRMLHEDEGGAGGRTVVCFGTDLTDRLTQADICDKPQPGAKAKETPAGDEFSAEGEVVMPISISPPALPAEASCGTAAIQQVHDFLMQVDERMEGLSKALSQGEIADLVTLAESLRDGAKACGLLDFSSKADRLRTAASAGEIDKVTGLVQKIVTLVRKHEPAGW